MPQELLKNVDGRNVLYVMAADPEYGPHLKSRFTPLMTGVGPVESAVSVAGVLVGLQHLEAIPDLVVCLGSAGSNRLEQGSVHQVSSVSYRDMDASPLGFLKGATPFLDLPVVVELPFRIPGIPAASLSTGANVVSGKTYEAIDADMVDMETFSVLRACHKQGIPFFGLRGISDGAEELKHIGDWTEYLHVIDEALSGAVDRLEQAIAEGLLDGT